MTELTGTWSLRSWYNETEDGQQIYPMGQDATGYISYSADGFVFVHISAPERAHYVLNDPYGGTAEEDSAAMKSQITYAGRYERQGDVVTHFVDHASFPNWVGTSQVRKLQFNGTYLRLSASGAVFQGKPITAYLEWERAAPSQSGSIKSG